jgi:hypothetical protein
MHDHTEPTPWGTGLLVTAIVAGLAAVAAYGFGAALAHVHPALSLAINVVAVGGAAPTVWRWRVLPVWRWVVYGAGLGVALGWIGLFVTLI